MSFTRCYACMRELPAADGPCPDCGRNNASTAQSQARHALPCGSVLANRYVIGRMLGQGGFGITYIGFDLALEARVCIKEYFPDGAAMRGSSQSCAVYWGSSANAQSLKLGRDSLVKEARKAVKLRDLSSVVKVWDVFYANETAYIVMDYVEGRSLRDELVQQGRPLREEACLRLFMPVMADLVQVHERGIIHRDISPDNIMLKPDGGLVLLDMGAAKDLSGGQGQSSLLVAKMGFSPIEQYRKNGKIGPWTDVYALCATLCYCINGRLQPSPMDRLSGEPLLLDGLSPQLSLIMKKGLAIQPEQRIQTVGELREAVGRLLVPQTPPKQEMPKQSQPKQTPQPAAGTKGKSGGGGKWLLILLAAAILFGVSRLKNSDSAEKSGTEQTSAESSTAEEKSVFAPDPLLTSPQGAGVLYRGTYEDNTVFGSTEYLRSQIVSVRFLDSLSAAPGHAWDASMDRDRSVLGWVERENGQNHLILAADGGVIGPRQDGDLFEDYSNLESVDFCNFDSSRMESLAGLFFRCAKLKEVDLSRLNTANVRYMNDVFSGCTLLRKVDLSGLDTTQVTKISSMFMDCKSLSEVDLSGLDLHNVTDVSYMFYGSNIWTVDLRGLAGAPLTSMAGMFSNCRNLISVDLSMLDTSQVTSMNGLFQSCDSLSDLNLGRMDTAQVTDMAYMFKGCKLRIELDVSGFDTACVTDMSHMFDSCEALDHLDLSAWDTSNVKNMGYMFRGCFLLRSIGVSSLRAAEGCYQVNMYDGCTSLQGVSTT